ncbi:MAG: DUF1569 domain-containing protein [Isosphaeraceae bacterium]
MTPGRRELAFRSLDEIMPEAERLLEGYRFVGNWSLSQVCRHLANTFRATAVTPPGTESPPPPTPEQLAARAVLERGRIPEGIPMRNPQGYPPEGLDDRAEIDGLREAMAVFVASPGPGPVHPRLGPMTKEEWIQFHCVHSAHHLSFLIPDRGGVR